MKRCCHNQSNARQLQLIDKTISAFVDLTSEKDSWRIHQAMYMFILLLAGIRMIISQQIKKVSKNATWGPDSHTVCLWKARSFIRQNEAFCKEENYPSDRPFVLSYDVKKCENTNLCHARFQCIVFDRSGKCSKAFLKQHIDGEFTMFCERWPPNMVLEGHAPENKAVCLSDEEYEKRKNKAGVVTVFLARAPNGSIFYAEPAGSSS